MNIFSSSIVYRDTLDNATIPVSNYSHAMQEKATFKDKEEPFAPIDD